MGLSVHEYGVADEIVLLLNGSGTPIAHLEAVAARLAATYRVLLPRFPGYETEPYAGAYTLDVDAALLESALSKRAVSRLRGVVAVSFGFHRAVTLARSGSVVVERIVGLGPVGGFTHEEASGLLAFADLVRDRNVPLEALAERNLSASYRATHHESAADVGRWIAAIDPRAFEDELRAMATASLREDAMDVPADVTLRTGSEDPVAPREAVLRLQARLPSADVEIVEGAGHLLLVEDFDASVRAIERALSAPRGRS